jgi:uncharacterized Zn finger protein
MVRFSKKVLRKKGSDLRSSEPHKTVTCSACGAVTRSSISSEADHICLICHARMLNEKFHSPKKRSDEDRERLAASE